MNEKDPSEFNSAEILATLLQKSGKASFQSVAKSVTLRLPSLDLCTVEAFARVTGDNRNKVLCYLIKAGIEATKAMLDEATLDKIEEADKEARMEAFSDKGRESNILMDSEDDK